LDAALIISDMLILKAMAAENLLRRWQSGQLHQTVNLAPSGSAGSNPARRTTDRTSSFSGNFCFAWTKEKFNHGT
jgi:hypothetical protein